MMPPWDGEGRLFYFSAPPALKVRNRVDRVAEYSTYSPKGGTTKAVVSSDFDKTPTTKDVVSSKSHY